MNIQDIKKDGKCVVVVTDQGEFAGREPMGLIRLLCRMGMAQVQAAFVYTRIKQEFVA